MICRLCDADVKSRDRLKHLKTEHAHGNWLGGKCKQAKLFFEHQTIQFYGDKISQTGEFFKRGNCYSTCEALYHLLGGKNSGFTPQYVKLKDGETHWFLRYFSGLILDPTAKQFKIKPNYSKAKGCGFLTKKPSKKAKALMEIMLWQ